MKSYAFYPQSCEIVKKKLQLTEALSNEIWLLVTNLTYVFMGK